MALTSSGSGKKPVNIEAMGKDLHAAMSAIMEEGEFSGGELERISKTFHDQVDHEKKLLSPVMGKDGNTIHIVRHNGIEEIGHRWSRMHVRRRTGRSETSREMAMYGALTAILSNLENEYYLKHVVSQIDFLKEFSSVTKDELNEGGKLIRPNPCEPIIRKDKERKPVLDALVKILESHEDLPAKELEAWVEGIKIK